MTESIATLRDKLQQLKSLHDSGTLDGAAYASAKARLERQLVESVLAEPGPAEVAPPARPSKRLLAALAVAVLVVAGAGYLWTGSPALVGQSSAPTAASVSPAAPHDASEAQFAAAVESLAQKLQEKPDNPEGWAMLARSYARLGRVDDALSAFEKAAAKRGDDARLLADWADVLAVKNNRSLEGEPMKLVERALAADPNEPKALSLAGTAAYNRKDFAAAVRYWETLERTAPPDSDFLPQLQASIAEARQLGGMAPAAAAPKAAAPAEPPALAKAAAGSAISGTVKLAPALAKQAAPEDTVFIYARPAEGSRMPLAILRKQVKDLPLPFTLDDSMAMSPAAKLSLFPKVVVSARVSKSGQAAPAAGDLTGQSAPVAPGASGLQIEIAEVVKN